MTNRLKNRNLCLKGIILLFVASLLSACDKQTVYHSFQSLPTEGWLREDTLSFDVKVTDSLWKGDGWGGLYQTAVPAGSVRIGKPGTYLFKVAYTLPDERLQGINDIGIKLKR